MATWAEVTRWNSAPLNTAVGEINGAYNKVVACSDDLRGINTAEGWHGTAAGAAAGEVNQIIDGLEEYAAEVASLRRSAGDVSDAILGVMNGVKEAEELARTHHFSIGGDGTVVDHGPPPDTPEDQKEAVARERLTIAAEVRDRVTEVLKSATDIDDDFCAVLDRLLAGHTIDATGNDNENTSLAAAGNSGAVMGSLSIPAPPLEGATAAQNAAYWATLSDAQRNRLAKDRPELVGPRDGFSTEQRHIANRTLLDRQQAGLQHERDELQKRINEFPRTGGGDIKLNDQREFDELTSKLETLDKKLEGINSITDRLDDKTPGRPPAFLLGISSDNAGQAIVAIGNPDEAANVATYVPGTFSGLDGIGTDINRSDLMLRAAQDAGSNSTAVITWAGYDAPQSILPDAGTEGFANNAAPRLDRFQDGLAAAHNPDQQMNSTVIGHSYGTTVVGHTARDAGLAADNVVFVASPGVGVEHTQQLHLDGVPKNQVGSHVYATSAITDPIPAATNLHHPVGDAIDPLGPDPTDSRFGGHTFDSNPTSPITSHSDYWNRDSKSLIGMGNIIAGRAPQ